MKEPGKNGASLVKTEIFPAPGEYSGGQGRREIMAACTDRGGGRPLAVPCSISQELPGQRSLGLVLLHPRAYHIQLAPGIQSSQREWGGGSIPDRIH